MQKDKSTPIIKLKGLDSQLDSIDEVKQQDSRKRIMRKTKSQNISKKD